MSADFWAGYVSGAAGIIIGNPLDLIKTRLQAGDAALAQHAASPQSLRSTFENAGTLVRGATAPILGYGALNGLLYYTYNRSLTVLGESYTHPTSLTKIWAAGAVGGLASFVVSAPTELIKCRAQVLQSASSLSVAKDINARDGLRGLYLGGGVTSVRDAVGYGFYFWSYELLKRALNADSETDSARQAGLKILLAGGIAGVVTWASIFPLDVIKTRVQTQTLGPAPSNITEEAGLISRVKAPQPRGAVELAKHAYATEGVAVFFRGLGICSVRAFIVNAVQWAVYEWMLRVLAGSDIRTPGHVKANASAL